MISRTVLATCLTRCLCQGHQKSTCFDLTSPHLCTNWSAIHTVCLPFTGKLQVLNSVTCIQPTARQSEGVPNTSNLLEQNKIAGGCKALCGSAFSWSPLPQFSPQIQACLHSSCTSGAVERGDWYFCWLCWVTIRRRATHSSSSFSLCFSLEILYFQSCARWLSKILRLLWNSCYRNWRQGDHVSDLSEADKTKQFFKESQIVQCDGYVTPA